MTTFRKIFDQRKVSGEVGIEIEVEGANLPMNLKSYWKVIEDNSLRGESAEYCLKGPMSRKSYPKALKYLERKFAENNTVVSESYRTSVHIHINIQELDWIKVYNYLLLYFILEECLIEFCGENRKGYCFCLTAKDAEWLMVALKDIASSQDWYAFESNDLRYAALNVCAIAKFGSLEFRSMRGATDVATIIKWVSTLLKLKDSALSFKDPREIVSMFSLLGPRRFIEKVLEEHSDMIFSVEEWENKCYEGMERVQPIAYDVKWKTKATKKVKGKPSTGRMPAFTRAFYTSTEVNFSTGVTVSTETTRPSPPAPPTDYAEWLEQRIEEGGEP